MKRWDVFISHASEDNADVVLPLTEQLKAAGVRVWFDRHELSPGDSLREKIDEGLAQSRFGIVVLSEAFLAKHWPRQELNGLAAREEHERKVIPPIWHNLTKERVAAVAPLLADRFAVNTAQGIPAIVASVVAVVFRTYEFVIANEHDMVVLPLLDETERYAFALGKPRRRTDSTCAFAKILCTTRRVAKHMTDTRECGRAGSHPGPI